MSRNKMMQFVNWRMRVTISDTRTLVGTFLAFDKHMNIVLGDTEEYRTTKAKKATGEKEEKRTLGLVLLRGETVVSLSAEAPPPPKPRAKAAGRGGPGVGQAAGRGIPVTPLAQAPKGLTGPVRGLGGPGAQVMMPQLSAPPLSYGATPPRPQGGAPPQQPQPGGQPMFGGRGGPPMMMMPPVGFPGGNPQFGRGGPPPGGQGPPQFFGGPPPPFGQQQRPQ